MKRYESQEKVARWLEEAGMPEHTTVAPLIFEFSKGNSSSELGCAHLCAVLAGYPVPLQLATAGFEVLRLVGSGHIYDVVVYVKSCRSPR